MAISGVSFKNIFHKISPARSMTSKTSYPKTDRSLEGIAMRPKSSYELPSNESYRPTAINFTAREIHPLPPRDRSKEKFFGSVTYNTNGDISISSTGDSLPGFIGNYTIESLGTHCLKISRQGCCGSGIIRPIDEETLYIDSRNLEKTLEEFKKIPHDHITNGDIERLINSAKEAKFIATKWCKYGLSENKKERKIIDTATQKETSVDNVRKYWNDRIAKDYSMKYTKAKYGVNNFLDKFCEN